MTTLASRAKALLARFGDVNHQDHDDEDGYYACKTVVGDLHIYVTAISSDETALNASVYDTSGDDWETLLNLQNVQDDDLVESFIRQIIDHHNGKQVV